MKTNPLFDRLSRGFLLNDFMYCDSVIRRSMANVFQPGRDDICIKHGRVLAAHLYDIVRFGGPISITYGYISPEVSRRIVKYQDPDKPSYHRWDLGAAADIVVHREFLLRMDPVSRKWSYVDADHTAPAVAAASIAQEFPFSRMITYSESPCICFGVNANETIPRSAFYENRYEGKARAKPKFITHRKLPDPDEIQKAVQVHGWVGAGYPTYHGGGRVQYHHVRLGRHLLLSDCLRAPDKISEGHHNRPPSRPDKQRAFAGVAGALDEALEPLYDAYLWHASIVATHGADYGFVDKAFKPFNRLSSWDTGEGGMILAVPEGEGTTAVNALLSGGAVVERTLSKQGSDFILVRNKGVE